MRMFGTPPSTWASCTPSSAMRFISEMRLPARKLRPSRFSPSASIDYLAGGFGDRNDRLEQRAFAVLNILSHRVQVGRQRHAGREDALAVLAFALAVELFPPLVDVLELRLVGAENLDLLAAFVQLRCARLRKLPPGSLRTACRSAVARSISSRAAHQRGDVHAGGGQRQQSHGRQHREPAAHVVGNDEGRRSPRCRRASSSAPRALVGDGHDALGGLLPCRNAFRSRL